MKKMNKTEKEKFMNYKKDLDNLYAMLEKFEGSSDRHFSQIVVALGNSVRKSSLSLENLLEYIGRNQK